MKKLGVIAGIFVAGAVALALFINNREPLPSARVDQVSTVVPTQTPGAASDEAIAVGVRPRIQLPLATPQPGKAQITGLLLCNSLPQGLQSIYLMIQVEDDLFAILEADYTDEAGRWLFDDLLPGTYAVSGEGPAPKPEQPIVITADSTADLGNITLPASRCS